MCSTHTLMCGVSRRGSLLCTWPYRFTHPRGKSVHRDVRQHHRRIGVDRQDSGRGLVLGGVHQPGLPIEVVVPDHEQLAARCRPDFGAADLVEASREARRRRRSARCRRRRRTDSQLAIIAVPMCLASMNGLLQYLMMLPCRRCRSDQTHVRCSSGR